MALLMNLKTCFYYRPDFHKYNHNNELFLLICSYKINDLFFFFSIHNKIIEFHNLIIFKLHLTCQFSIFLTTSFLLSVSVNNAQINFIISFFSRHSLFS